MDDATHAYIDENRKLRDRIATLEKANADLHSRLDELRWLLNSVSGLAVPTLQHLARRSQPPHNPLWPSSGGAVGQGDTMCAGETASDRLAEHAATAERFAKHPLPRLTPDPPAS